MANDETLTVQEVADCLKVSRTTVWRWCHQGLLPAFKIGRGWRVRRVELEKMIQQKLPDYDFDKTVVNPAETGQ